MEILCIEKPGKLGLSEQWPRFGRKAGGCFFQLGSPCLIMFDYVWLPEDIFGIFWHPCMQWTPLRLQDLADFCCGGEELPPDSPESLGGHRSIEILCRKPLYLRGNQMAKPWFPSVSCRFSFKPIHSPSLYKSQCLMVTCVKPHSFPHIYIYNI